jgi:cell division protein FtsX
MTDAMAAATRVRAHLAPALAGLLPLALVLSACGGASKAAERSGTVKVYFCTTVSMPDCRSDATSAQEQAVGASLRRTPNVTKVAFVSKVEALKRIKKKKLIPGLSLKQLPANPLPDEWVVTVNSARNEAKVGTAICAAHYAGVERCRNSGGERMGVTWGSPLLDRIRRLG